MLHKQNGSTLLVALIMLMLLTLMAISAMRSTTSGIQVVGNAQFHEEALTAAQQGIEATISSNFTTLPAAATVNVTFGAANYTAKVEKPTCVSSIAMVNSELDVTKPDDAVCLSTGSLTNTGTVSASGVVASSAQSWCFKQNWDIRATVADTKTGANAAVHQGVFIKVPAGTECL